MPAGKHSRQSSTQDMPLNNVCSSAVGHRATATATAIALLHCPRLHRWFGRLNGQLIRQVCAWAGVRSLQSRMQRHSAVGACTQQQRACMLREQVAVSR